MDTDACKCSCYLRAGERHSGWAWALKPHFCFIPHIVLCYSLFYTCITWEVKREKGEGKKRMGKPIFLHTSPSPSSQGCSRAGGILASSLHIMLGSEKCPDTLAHCQSLSSFVSNSADVSPVNILDSSSSAHSLLQGMLWSAVTRKRIEHNTNSFPWHSKVLKDLAN